MHKDRQFRRVEFEDARKIRTAAYGMLIAQSMLIAGRLVQQTSQLRVVSVPTFKMKFRFPKLPRLQSKTQLHFSGGINKCMTDPSDSS